MSKRVFWAIVLLIIPYIGFIILFPSISLHVLYMAYDVFFFTTIPNRQRKIFRETRSFIESFIFNAGKAIIDEQLIH